MLEEFVGAAVKALGNALGARLSGRCGEATPLRDVQPESPRGDIALRASAELSNGETVTVALDAASLGALKALLPEASAEAKARQELTLSSAAKAMVTAGLDAAGVASVGPVTVGWGPEASPRDRLHRPGLECSFEISRAGRMVARGMVFCPGAWVESGEIVTDDEVKDILSGFSPADEADHSGNGSSANNLQMVMDIELVATVRLGAVEMPISEVLNLGPGSIIEVDRLVDEPVELLVNGKLIARGDVVVVDERFGLRITEIVGQKERIESLA